MSTFVKAYQVLERWLNGLGAAVLVCMMLMVMANVVGRYIFNSPILGTLEFTEFFMVAAVYMALANTQALKAHIDITFVTSRITGKKKLMCDLITYVVGFIFFGLIVWQGSLMTIEAYELEEVTIGTVEVLEWPSKIFVPLGSLFITVRYLIDGAETIKGLMGRTT